MAPFQKKPRTGVTGKQVEDMRDALGHPIPLTTDDLFSGRPDSFKRADAYIRYVRGVLRERCRVRSRTWGKMLPEDKERVNLKLSVSICQ